MAQVQLFEFIDTNRDELILRCRAKVAKRMSPPPTEGDIDHGVPLFLEQLIVELRHGPSQTREIAEGAGQHGRDLLQQGFTVAQVVHDYGDVCQSVTDLAMESNAPIAIDDFQTLNRCLDDAIAGAVGAHERGQQVFSDGRTDELRHLVNSAVAAFDAIQSGTVGVTGTTGALVRRSLTGILALIDKPARP